LKRPFGGAFFVRRFQDCLGAGVHQFRPGG
jgi:hypothetical protein